MAQKYLEKFESVDTVISVIFPLNLYEWSSRQALRLPRGVAVGADYSFDFLGFQPAPKQDGQERLRFASVGADASIEAEMQLLRADCVQIGRGKLFTLDSSGNRLWAYARLSAMPSFTVSYDRPRITPQGLDFIRMSDWYDDTQTTGTKVVTATSGSFIIANVGNAPVKNAIFRFRANTSAGLSNPTLSHLGNLHSFSSTRDSSGANDELRVDCGKPSVEWSTDDGATYADDYVNFALGATQVAIFVLEPGSNTINYTCSGTPNFDIDYSFYPAYH